MFSGIVANCMPALSLVTVQTLARRPQAPCHQSSGLEKPAIFRRHRVDHRVARRLGDDVRTMQIDRVGDAVDDEAGNLADIRIAAPDAATFGELGRLIAIVEATAEGRTAFSLSLVVGLDDIEESHDARG